MCLSCVVLFLIRVDFLDKARDVEDGDVGDFDMEVIVLEPALSALGMREDRCHAFMIFLLVDKYYGLLQLFCYVLEVISFGV